MTSYNIINKISVCFVLVALSTSALHSQSLEQKAAQIHKNFFTIDTHNDTALHINNPQDEYRVTKGQVTFPMMKEGGLDAALFAIYIGQKDRKSTRLNSSH